MKLLLTGDLHLGRASTRTGDDGASVHRTVAAWERMVALALREGVRAVLLSGDIVDGENKYWESLGPLEEGIARLGKAGVLTVAVSGNHDHDVFPRLARGFPAEVFRLLGEGGAWERMVVHDTEGMPALAIDGWSFPSQHVRENPVAGYPFSRPGDLPVLGMIHGDLGVSGSVYAPLSSETLVGAPVDAWLLGHVHVPSLTGDAPWVLYPGSPQAMDPGETGLHGPWLVDVTGGRMGKPRQVLGSSVWYDRLELDVSGWTDPERDLRQALATFVGAIQERCGGVPEMVSMRPVLTGRTPLHHEVRERIDSLVETQDGYTEQGVRIQLDRWTDGMMPEIDVDVWSGTDTVPGGLLALAEQSVPDGVLAAFRHRLASSGDGSFATATDEELEAYLREAAAILLSEVL
jgi:predicted phosphodiesterase